MRSQPLIHAAGLSVLILVWGTTWAAIRVGLEGVPPFTGVSVRFAIASAVLFALNRAMKVSLRGGPRLYALWAVEATVGFSLSYAVVYWAEQWVPSGLASVLFSTFPLFVALLAHFMLPAERLHRLSVIGIFLGFGGVSIIFSEDLAVLGGAQVLLASVVFLFSPIGSAVAHVAVKKWGEDFHPLALTPVPMAATSLLVGLLALLTESEKTVTWDWVSLGAILYLAIFGTAVTFTLYYWLLARIEATRMALITYGIPIVAVIVGATFLEEPLTARTMLGAACVLVGVALAMGKRGGRSSGPLPETGGISPSSGR